MTEFELFRLLRDHFPPREFALLPQVANGIGAGAFRHCDALALGLWPSRGIRLHGFEIKTYRGDWIRELKAPEKAEAVAQYCNHWWIVAGHVGMVNPEELPPNWGLWEFVPEKKALKKKAPAPFLKAKAVDLAFVAAMLRRAQEVVTPDAIIAEAKEQAFKDGRQAGEANGKHAIEDLAKVRGQIRDFEKASGVKIDTWEGSEIGEAVRLVLNDTVSNRTERLRAIAKSILDALPSTGTEK